MGIILFGGGKHETSVSVFVDSYGWVGSGFDLRSNRFRSYFNVGGLINGFVPVRWNHERSVPVFIIFFNCSGCSSIGICSTIGICCCSTIGLTVILFRIIIQDGCLLNNSVFCIRIFVNISCIYCAIGICIDTCVQISIGIDINAGYGSIDMRRIQVNVGVGKISINVRIRSIDIDIRTIQISIDARNSSIDIHMRAIKVNIRSVKIYIRAIYISIDARDGSVNIHMRAIKVNIGSIYIQVSSRKISINVSIGAIDIDIWTIQVSINTRNSSIQIDVGSIYINIWPVKVQVSVRTLQVQIWGIQIRIKIRSMPVTNDSQSEKQAQDQGSQTQQSKECPANRTTTSFLLFGVNITYSNSSLIVLLRVNFRIRRPWNLSDFFLNKLVGSTRLNYKIVLLISRGFYCSYNLCFLISQWLSSSNHLSFLISKRLHISLLLIGSSFTSCYAHQGRVNSSVHLVLIYCRIVLRNRVAVIVPESCLLAGLESEITLFGELVGWCPAAQRSQN